MSSIVEMPVLHSLPFSTSFRGTTDFSANFKPEIVAQQHADDNKKPERHQVRFRGRRLYAERVDLPAGFKGSVVVIPSQRLIGYRRVRNQQEAEALRAESTDLSSEELEERLLKKQRKEEEDRETGGAEIAGQPPAVLTTFSEIMVWDHDRAPTAQLQRTCGLYTAVAAALHTAVSN